MCNTTGWMDCKLLSGPRINLLKVQGHPNDKDQVQILPLMGQQATLRLKKSRRDNLRLNNYNVDARQLKSAPCRSGAPLMAYRDNRAHLYRN